MTQRTRSWRLLSRRAYIYHVQNLRGGVDQRLNDSIADNDFSHSKINRVNNDKSGISRDKRLLTTNIVSAYNDMRQVKVKRQGISRCVAQLSDRGNNVYNYIIYIIFLILLITIKK